MTSPFKTKSFEKLKDKWYEKLKKSGFHDVETDEDHLKEWEGNIFARYDEHQIPFTTEYFRMAGQFLYSHEFENKREKFVWEKHQEGLSIDAISAVMKKRKYKSNSRSSVHLIIKKLAKEMFKNASNDDGSQGSDNDL